MSTIGQNMAEFMEIEILAQALRLPCSDSYYPKAPQVQTDVPSRTTEVWNQNHEVRIDIA